MSKRTTVPAACLQETIDALGVSSSELADALGLSRGTIPGWLAKGQCPKYIQIACEGLRRRAGKGAQRKTLFVSCPAAYTEAIVKMAEGIGAKVTVLDLEK